MPYAPALSRGYPEATYPATSAFEMRLNRTLVRTTSERERPDAASTRANPVYTECHLPLSADNISFASRALFGFPRIRLPKTTTVSAPTTVPRLTLPATSRAFSSASRLTLCEGVSSGTKRSATVLGRTTNLRPICFRSNRLRGDCEARMNDVLFPLIFISLREYTKKATLFISLAMTDETMIGRINETSL